MNGAAQALLSGAELSLATRDLEAALDNFARAETAGAEPDRCAAGRWMLHMLQGDFESAWRESDAIRRRGQPDPHRLWQGESLRNQRVILRCLHGFGDAVQFLRYVPRLRAIARTLVVEVNPRFAELATCFEGVDEVIAWGSHAPARAPEWDVQVEVMELPYLFRTQLQELPLRKRYLNLPLQANPHRTGLDPFRTGLVWTAGHWKPDRSIPFNTLYPLVNTEGCEFWNLEANYSAQEDAPPLRRKADCGDNIMRLAEQIQQLDLVITVDTLAAHLAGALGVPCWVLLQQAADWRWMHGRPDSPWYSTSPWYPTLRLFRQPTAGDWISVISSVHTALREHVAAHHHHEVCAR